MTPLLIAFALGGALIGVICWAIQSDHAAQQPQPQSQQFGRPHDPYHGFTSNDFQRAALDIIWHDRPHTDNSYFGGTVAKCDEALAQIAKQRIQYSTAQPERLRDAIMSWLDYYEKRTREDLRDVQTQKRRLEMDAYETKREAERERTNALLRAIKEDNAAKGNLK